MRALFQISGRFRRIAFVLVPIAIFALFVSACQAGWSTVEGADGARYAVPPGWKALVGEEAKKKQQEGMRMLPENIRSLALMPDLAFIAYRGDNMLAVYSQPTGFDMGIISSLFGELVDVYQHALEMMGQELEKNSNGAIRLKVGEIRKAEAPDDPDVLASLEATFQITMNNRELPVRSKLLVYRNRLVNIVATNNAPLDEFLRRSSLRSR